MCYNVITEDNLNFHVHQVYLAIELSITTESWTVHFVNKIYNNKYGYNTDICICTDCMQISISVVHV